MSQIELETASDDWFVDANADGLPEFAIGRLPVRTPAQAATVVGKITGYDAEPGGDWAKGIALVTDTDDATVNFRASSAGVETRVPSTYQVNRLDRDVIGVAPLRSRTVRPRQPGPAHRQLSRPRIDRHLGQARRAADHCRHPGQLVDDGIAPAVCRRDELSQRVLPGDLARRVWPRRCCAQRRRRGRGVGVLEPDRGRAPGTDERRAVPAGVRRVAGDARRRDHRGQAQQ